MSQLIQPRSRQSVGQSFLTLDDGPSSPPPTSIMSHNVRLASIGHYSAHDAGSTGPALDSSQDHDRSLDTESVLTTRRPASPPSFSSRLYDSSRYNNGYDDHPSSNQFQSSLAPSIDSSQNNQPHHPLPHHPVNSSNPPANTRGSRLGALLGRSLPSVQSPNRPNRQQQNDSHPTRQPTADHDEHNPAVSQSTLANRTFPEQQLRNRASAPRLKDIDFYANRPEGHRLAPAFGLRSEATSSADPPLRANSALAMHPVEGAHSPVLPDSSYSGSNQPRSLNRPASHSNLSQTVSPPPTGLTPSRPGRLSRLQYNKNDGFSLGSVARDTTGANFLASPNDKPVSVVRELDDSHLLQGQSQPLERPEASPRDATPARMSRSMAKMMGLGIGTPGGSSLFDETSPLSGPPSPLNPHQHQRDLILPSLTNARTTATSPPTEREINDLRPHSQTKPTPLRDSFYKGQPASSPNPSHPVGQAWSTTEPEAASSQSAPRIRSTKAAVSRTSAQESYHNRFSRQTSAGPSMAKQDSWPGDSSSYSANASYNSSSQRQYVSSSRHSSMSNSVTNRNSTNDASASPSAGNLSDAAIAALGAVPGADPESLLNSNGAPLSSKNVLTIALQKAQNAVQLDSSNNVPEAIAAYKQAVRLLQEVMERIAPKTGKRTRPSREEERRRLRVIHDTYADRIRLLSMIYSPGQQFQDSESAGEIEQTSETHGQSPEQGWSNDNPQLGLNEEWSEHGAHSHGENYHSKSDHDESSFLALTPVRAQYDQEAMQFQDYENEYPSHLDHRQQKDSAGHEFNEYQLESPHKDRSTLSKSLGSSAKSSRRQPSGTFRFSAGMRTSVVMSIADEQNTFAQEALDELSPEEHESMPSISIQPFTPRSNFQGSELEDASVEKESSAALPRQHSTELQYARLDAHTSLSTNASQANQTRSFGDEKDPKPSAAPLFDAADASSTIDDRANQVSEAARFQKRKPSLVPALPPTTEQGERRSSRLSLNQRVRSISVRNNTLKEKASMPVLPRGPTFEYEFGSGSPKHSKRSSTSDSLEEEARRYHEAAAADAETETYPQLPKWSNYPVENSRLLSRPRAATVVNSRSATSSPAFNSGSFLVSPTTNTGTISLRRKMGIASHVDAAERNTLEVFSDGMQRTKSADQAEATVRTRKEVMSPSAALNMDSGQSESYSNRPSLLSSFGRQRAVSQPGSRRPSIPTAFIEVNAAHLGVEQPPPVPNLARKFSEIDGNSGGKRSNLKEEALVSAAGLDRPNLPARLSSVANPQQPVSFATNSDEAKATNAIQSLETRRFLQILDIFPTGLPSLASGTPSFATMNSGPLFPLVGANRHGGDAAGFQPLPSLPLLRPFYVMRQLFESIQRGGYVTERLYVPKSIWAQQGVKLVSVENKVRAIELICSGIEGVEKGGEALLLPLGSHGGLEASNASRFVKHLDELDVLLIDIQNNLAKKLGFLETVTGKKSGSSFGSFGSKLTRSLDRMTNGTKNLDSLVAYVESLSKLFRRSQVLDRHLQSLLRSQGVLNWPENNNNELLTPVTSPTTAQPQRDGYFALPVEIKSNIESRLKRSSDFFAKVILAFVLRDLGMLLEKFVKKGSSVFTD